MNFNFFYHNNCPEFQEIKQRILSFKKPSKQQLAHNAVMADIRNLYGENNFESGYHFCEEPNSICEQNGHSFAFWLFAMKNYGGWDDHSPIYFSRYHSCPIKSSSGYDWDWQYNLIDSNNGFWRH